jgi:hypothetical protein
MDFSAFEEQPDFSHAWFPTAEFDESIVDGSLAVARSGEGAVLIRGSSSLSVVTEGPSAHAELRQQGRKTRWIIRVAAAASLSDARDRFAGLAIVEEPNGDFILDDPEYGQVSFRADGTVEAEGRRLAPKEFTVSGEATLLAAR